MHDEIFHSDNHWYAPELGAALQRHAKHDHVEVRVHPYFTDYELWDYLSSITVSVLPYRFGTHSGWLEACFDLGTAAVVPSCGFYNEQRPCEVFEFTEESFDAGSLYRAVRTTYDRWAKGFDAPRANWCQRRAERVRIAQSHRNVYQSATRMSAPLRVALIASNRFPLCQPFAGGLEAHVWHLARALVERGHEVSLFAGSGSDLSLECAALTVRELMLSAAAQADPSASPAAFMADHHAYLNLMVQLADPRSGFDIVHNHSLHHLPVAMAPTLGTPMLTTLHTPPTPWLESALDVTGSAGTRFAAVSRHTAAA